MDFQYHGGIYRDVKIVAVDMLHVTDPVYAGKAASGGVFVSYPEVSEAKAVVQVKTHLQNDYTSGQEAELLTELVEPSGKVVASTSSKMSIAAGKDSESVQNIELANPRLWHPNSPNLYYVRTTVKLGSVVADSVVTRIGIRSIKWSHDNGLEINGKRLYARGVNLHQEIYGLGNAVPNSAIYQDVKRVRDGGFNFIRGSHYPHDPEFYRAADELGILVEDSMTGWQRFYDMDSFKENTYQELRDMIRANRNFPSIVAWEASLNESSYSDEWAKKAHEIVHEEYPGDQAYSAQWRGEFADIFTDASQHAIRSTSDSRPKIISEYADWDFGGANSTSRQKREDGDNAMLISASNVMVGYNENLSMPWLAADAYWDFADYAGFSNYGITRSGLVDMYRIPKFGYYLMQSQRDPNLILDNADSGPMVFIANHWTEKSPTKVRVYSNCEEVALYLNGTLFETRKPLEGTNLPHAPFIFNLKTFTPGKLEAQCLIGGSIQRTHVVQTPGAPASIRLTAEAPSINADMSDARLVFIDILDANGTVVVSDSSEVGLSVKGPATIVGPKILTMKGGQLAVWIRAGREAGTITLTAGAGGLLAGTVSIESLAVAGMPSAPSDR